MFTQRTLDAFMAAMRTVRSDYHLTLGEAISALAKLPPDAPLSVVHNGTESTFDKVSSYRGYYSDLALEPSDKPMVVSDAHSKLTDTLGQTFEGYKGGNNLMDEHTPLWFSAWGAVSDLAVVGIQLTEELLSNLVSKRSSCGGLILV